jgi:hypothetical protein
MQAVSLHGKGSPLQARLPWEKPRKLDYMKDEAVSEP